MHHHETEIEIGRQLASGSIELAFESGATTRVHGPALFEIESKNGGFLHYENAFSVADNDSSQGFTIRTASGTYVDQGTEFITQATTDGSSQRLVVRDADAADFGRRRVLGGNGIGFELGESPIMIQIERGTEMPNFEFPTIPSPSSKDYASTYAIDIEVDYRGRLDVKTGVAPVSADASVLTNGRAQKNHDDPRESFFFRDDTIGYLVFDLGEMLPVSGIRVFAKSMCVYRPRPEFCVARLEEDGERAPQPMKNAAMRNSGPACTFIASVASQFSTDEKYR